MENKVAISITNLSKKVKDRTLLDNINITFSKGEIHGIVGRNGSGKTMLFKAICGLINATKGEIHVFGQIIKNGAFPKDVGVIIENPGFLPQYSGFKNLKFLASINNKISDEDINHYIKLVKLDPLDKRPVKKYSLGMRQRLGIAQALMEKPGLLILDEPMNGLDEEGVKEIRALLLKLKEKSVTILLCSHNSEDIKELCDHIYKMDNGVLTKQN
ncbi:ABC transporter ATP-binding protein [Clostridium sporogenes]|uniref:ABC transporter ATP-binding protein n=1 Tax=Clostridium sporogenes TaxID=1509 RepID=UPI0029053D0A|nr:ABC transporter ATP-binding protein [Clostridium botulinum]